MRRHFESAVAQHPFGRHQLAFIGAASLLRPLGKVAAIEQHDGIGRGRAGGRTRSHQARMRPAGIVYVPGLAWKHGRIKVAGRLAHGMTLLTKQSRQEHGGGANQAFHV